MIVVDDPLRNDIKKKLLTGLVLLTLLRAADRIALAFGGVAQLARAREWHSRGHGFDSLHLQKKHGR